MKNFIKNLTLEGWTLTICIVVGVITRGIERWYAPTKTHLQLQSMCDWIASSCFIIAVGLLLLLIFSTWQDTNKPKHL